MQQAGPLPSLGIGRREITDQSSHFTDEDLRPRVKVPEPAWQTEDHIMVYQFTQFRAILATVAMANCSFCPWRSEKRQGANYVLGFPVGFRNLCYPGLHDPGYGCLLMVSVPWKVGPKPVSFELVQSSYQGWCSHLAHGLGSLGL